MCFTLNHKSLIFIYLIYKIILSVLLCVECYITFITVTLIKHIQSICPDTHLHAALFSSCLNFILARKIYIYKMTHGLWHSNAWQAEPQPPYNRWGGGAYCIFGIRVSVTKYLTTCINI